MAKSSNSLQPPRGMRDFYPEEMRLRKYIFDAWTHASELFGFQAYDACVVESLDLLKRKAGEEIVDQIYTFKDKSDRDLALRPEMTPTLARMVAARQGALSLPLKWYTTAQCFRYERMTRGRKREHYQWNLDIIGEESMAAEAEIIAVAVHALSLMGLTKDHVQVHVSSRSILTELLSSLGIPEEMHQATFLALDKRDKVKSTDLIQTLLDSGLEQAHVDRVIDMMNISTLDDAIAMLPPDAPSVQQMKCFFELIKAYGLTDVIVFDISVIRGLAYYTGIVFECFDTYKTSRAIFGGGRYDNLLSDIGGKPATGVGLGFGDVVVADVLTDAGKLASDLPGNVSLAIGFMTEDEHLPAISLAKAIRSAGTSVELGLAPEKAKRLFSRASKIGATEAAYIGPDDVAAGTVNIKNMSTGDQRSQTL